MPLSDSPHNQPLHEWPFGAPAVAPAQAAPHPCQRCGSETWTDVDYAGCSDCREPADPPEPRITVTRHKSYLPRLPWHVRLRNWWWYRRLKPAHRAAVDAADKALMNKFLYGNPEGRRSDD